MTLDKKSLDRLLELNDDRLRAVLGRLLSEYGVDPRTVPLSSLDVGRLRTVLRAATDEDITRFMQLMQTTGGGKGGAPRE